MDSATVEAVSKVSGRSFENFQEATRNVLEMLEAQLPQSVVFVAHLDGGADALTIIDARGDASFGLAPGDTSDLNESFCVRMASNRGPQLANHVPEEAAYRDLPGASALDIGSYLGVPLELGDGSRVGSLCALSHSEGNYSNDDLQLISVMGRLLAYELERQNRERELERLSEQLRALSQTDPLTSVLNRRGFEPLLEREWSLAQRGTVHSEVVVIDVDDFKSINDTRGHPEGDRVLRQVAERLRDCARTTDVVGRIGGDEFAVILVGTDEGEGLATYIARVHEATIQDEEAPSLSFGWCDLADAPTPEEALNVADRMMYERRGRRPERVIFS